MFQKLLRHRAEKTQAPEPGVVTPPRNPLDNMFAEYVPPKAGNLHSTTPAYKACSCAHKPCEHWVHKLPTELRPHRLMLQFGDLAMKIGLLWDDRQALLKYIDDLIVDRHGSAQAFPQGVVVELMRLYRHLDDRLVTRSDFAMADPGFGARDLLEGREPKGMKA